MTKVRMSEFTFQYATRHLVLSYQVPSKYSEVYSSYRANMKSISNKTKGDNSKSKKVSCHSCTRQIAVVEHSTADREVPGSNPGAPLFFFFFFFFFFFSSNISYFNSSRKLFCSSRLVPHFYQIPSKCSKRYSSQRADTKSISKTNKGR